MRKPHEAQDGPLPFEDQGELRARLGAYLTQATGAPVTVEKLVKFPAGFSWITYAAHVAGFPPANDVILRIGPPYGLFAPYSAMTEFDALSAIEGAGVPAPRVYFASDDANWLGAPFFLSEKVEGDTPLPWGSQGQTLEGERRASLAADFIDALAALHVFDWRSTPLAARGAGVTLENAAQLQIDDWEAALPTLGVAAASDGASHTRLAARPRAARSAGFAGAWRLPARQFPRTRRTHLGHSRLGACAPRRSRRRPRLGVPAAVSRRHAAGLRPRQRSGFPRPLRGAVRGSRSIAARSSSIWCSRC